MNITDWIPRWLRPAQRSGGVAQRLGLLGGFGEDSGVSRGPGGDAAALQQFRGWVYAAAMLNAQAVAAVPLRLYVRRRPGRKLFATRPVATRHKRRLLGELPETRHSPAVIAKLQGFSGEFELVSEPHPALSLLTTANPHFNGFDLAVLRVLYQELTGNAYLHVVPDPLWGQPAELWPIPSPWVRVIPDAHRFLAGYAIGHGPDRVSLPPEQVVHFRYPNPHDLHYGLGKVEAAWGAISLQQAKRQMDTSVYANMARPDYAVIVRSGAGDEQLRRFEAKIAERLKGPKKSGQFLGITGDVDLKPLNFAPADIGDPDRVLEEIALVFGLPRDKLLGNATYANAEQAELQWLKQTITPLLRMDEQKLNEAYLPLFGLHEDAVLAYDDPLPENRAFELKRRTQLVNAGIMTIDEARTEEGLA